MCLYIKEQTDLHIDMAKQEKREEQETSAGAKNVFWRKDSSAPPLKKKVCAFTSNRTLHTPLRRRCILLKESTRLPHSPTRPAQCRRPRVPLRTRHTTTPSLHARDTLLQRLLHQARTMARGLSREQSLAKNQKKAAGLNKGNQESLTPSQRAERCVRDGTQLTDSL